jgi:hypothetical protein
LRGIIDYLPAACAFLAALIAVLGKEKTWRPNERGLKKLSAPGWAAMLIAIVSLGAAFLLTTRAQERAQVAAHNREQLQSLAYRKLLDGPLQELRGALDELSRLRYADPYDIDNVSGLLSDEELLSADHFQELLKVNLLPLKPLVRPVWEGRPAVEYISVTSEEAIEDSDRILAIFAPFLEASTVERVSELTSHKFTQHLRSLYLKVLYWQTRGVTEYPAVDAWQEESYRDFVSKLRALEQDLRGRLGQSPLKPSA